MDVRADDGFSLPELLVVALLMGILAAMIIPAYLSQVAKAHDAEAKDLISSAQVALKTYQDDNGDYAGADVPALVRIEPTLGASSGALDVSTGRNHFTLQASSKSGNVFTLAEQDGATSRACATAGSAGCAGDGSW